MSVKIRLKRAGTKGRPFYRVVVIDSRMQRDGRFIEEIGYYDPLEKPQVFNVDRDKADQWIGKGATPSDTVRNLLKRPNSVIEARVLNRDFTPGPARVRTARPEVSNQPSGEGRDGRGGRGGRGGRSGGGRSGGGRGEGRGGEGRGEGRRGGPSSR